jgi:hypothetical protein
MGAAFEAQGKAVLRPYKDLNDGNGSVVLGLNPAIWGAIAGTGLAEMVAAPFGEMRGRATAVQWGGNF